MKFIPGTLLALGASALVSMPAIADEANSTATSVCVTKTSTKRESLAPIVNESVVAPASD